MGIRRKARETALQALYQIDMTGVHTGGTVASLCEHYDVNRRAVPYAEELVSGVRGKLGEIDVLIQRHAQNWRIDRMSLVDRNILRLATYELCHLPGLPARVIINEAIELAKRYGTEESGAFVNGILDAIHLGLEQK